MKKSSSLELLGQFQPNLAKSILGWRGNMKGPVLLQGEINRKMRKCIDDFKKIFFSRTTRPISANLGTNHPWVKGILDYSYEGSLLFLRGDDNEIVKIHWQNFKIFFYRTTEPISTKLSRNHPCVKGFWVCSNGKATHFPRGDNYKIAKNLKSSSLEPLGQFQPNLAKSIPLWRGFFKFVQLERRQLFT